MPSPNHACDCCEQPPCAEPTLEFISTSATCDAEPCGEADPTVIADPEADPPVPARYCKVITTEHGDGEGTTTKTYTLDEETGVCSVVCGGEFTHRIGEVSFSSTTEYGDPPQRRETRTFNCRSDSGGIRTVYNEDCSVTVTLLPCSSESSTSDTFDPGSAWCRADGASGREYAEAAGMTLYDRDFCTRPEPEPGDTIEECYCVCPCDDGEPVATTPDVVTYTECAEVPPCTLTFPPYPEWLATHTEAPVTDPPTAPPTLLDGQGFSSTAFREWNADGTQKTERKIKWRLVHPPTGTCYLKVWVRMTFTPVAPPDPPVTDPPTPPTPRTPPTITEEIYEWSGTGNPCFTIPLEPVTAVGNIIHGAATEIGVPESNGETAVEILKFSCVEGYEPNIDDPDNKQPNGFPDPAWEAAPP
jgi:hypothetical protein